MAETLEKLQLSASGGIAKPIDPSNRLGMIASTASYYENFWASD
jgi:hypothetical protein